MWSPSADNWRLVFSSSISTSSTRMQCGNEFLVDIRSPTFKMVSSKLASLEVPKHTHVTTIVTSTGSDPNLLISLPRFKLSFYLNTSGEMESINFRNMVIDSDQSTGTMIGLESQLVLRQKDKNIDPFRARSVIIPFGDVELDGWPKVTIRISGEQSSVRYFKYDIDTILRSLVSVMFLADLYKVYLHAITSHPCPDPLTGRTGTEEALTSLLSAKCFPFQTLGIEEQEILYKIAELSPKRMWYPQHLKVMQSTYWGRIGPLGQHDDFHHLVHAIFEFHDRLEIFKKNSKRYCATKLPKRDVHLQQRSGSRNYNLFASDYAGHIPTPLHDDNYPPANRVPPHRSSTPSEGVVQRAANVSAMVQDWQSLLPTVTDLWKRIVSLEILFSDDFSLSYSRELRNFRLHTMWLSLYNQCRKKGTAARFALTFTLSALSYHLPVPDLCQLLPTFLAFAVRPEFSCIDPPAPWDSYDLRLGIDPDTHRLHSLIMEYVIPYSISFPTQLTRNPHESLKKFQKRCRQDYLSQCSSHAVVLVEEITSQWPRHRVGPSWVIISNSRPDLITLCPKLKDCVDDLFRQWDRNLQFRDHINQVQLILDYARSDLSHAVPTKLGRYERPILFNFKRMPRYSLPSLNDLLSQREPSNPQQKLELGPLPDLSEKENDDHNSIDLKHLFEEFIGSNNSMQRRYGRALDSSRQSQNQSREQGSKIFKEIPSSLGVPELELYRDKCGHQFSLTLASVVDVLSPSLPTELLEFRSGQWPRITLALLLGLLSQTSKYVVPLRWKSAIVLLAQSLMRYQRAQRLLRFLILGALEDFSKEYNNDLISPELEIHPEWLLIQVSIILSKAVVLQIVDQFDRLKATFSFGHFNVSLHKK